MTPNRDAIEVLVVDDSASVRETLVSILESDPGIRVAGAAADAFAAAKRMQAKVPDVMILDVEMPRMDGITFLRKIMAQHPLPVIICSGVTSQGSDAFFQAMEAGAVEVIAKPRVDTRQFLLEARVRVCDAVKAAAQARLRSPRSAAPLRVEKKLTADAMMPPPPATIRIPRGATDPIICIGASTGGTEALRVVLEELPPNSPGVVVVQHMPEGFTAAFARRLNTTCRVEVKEAEDNDLVRPGRVLIAAGNHHLLLERRGRGFGVNVKEGPLVSRHRPSVDVLFRSAAQRAGANAVGALLTGMGDDGARGLLEMRKAGAYTIAQDEASCVVFGMPRAAIELGAAESVLPLGAIAPDMLRAQVALA
jgi:two-component system chemotaxis response regulator CheB